MSTSLTEPTPIKISGHEHPHRIRSKQIKEEKYRDTGLIGEQTMGFSLEETRGVPLEATSMMSTTPVFSSDAALPPIINSSTSSTTTTMPSVMPDSSVLGKSTLVRDIELERMTKLGELAEVADKHLVEITTPEGISIKPMRASIQQVQAVQDAKTRRQRQSRVLVCNIQ